MKILCHFNHFYGGRSALVGKSTLGDRERRAKAVQTALAAIRALPFKVELRVCGFPESSLVPIDLDLTEIGNPMLIIYESIQRMFGELTGHDYFLNIEDDVLVNEGMIRNCILFNACSSMNEVYLPNRMETGADGSLYCVDLLAVGGWQKALSRNFENVRLGVAANHHSALFFLSRDQMKYAAHRINLSRRDLIFSGYMASAFANVHAPFLLWRSRSDVMAHHVVHLDNWLQSPSDGIPLPTKTTVSVPPGSSLQPMGYVDQVVLEGAFGKIRGWAIDEKGEAWRDISLVIDEYAFAPSDYQTKPVDRPDVVSAFPGAQRSCGYELSIAAKALLQMRNRPNVSHVSISFRNGPSNSTLLIEDGILKQGLRSVLSALPVIPNTNWLPEPEASRLSGLLGKAACFLEYGSGAATVQAVALGVPTVLAVESDVLRLEVVRYQAETIRSNTHLHVEHVDIGWRSNLHDNASDAYWRSYEQHPLEAWRYPLSIWEYCQTRNVAPDLILIHQRYSAACCLAALLFARAGCRIIIDDFRDGMWGSELLELIRPERQTGRAAEFVVQHDSSWNRDTLWHMLLETLAEPI